MWDGSDVTIVALKLAISFALFLAKNVHLIVSPLFNTKNYRLFSHNVVTMKTSAIGWPPWLITFWYLLISEQLYMLMHETMTWFLQIQRYQNGINQGGHPIALVSMATTLCETRLLEIEKEIVREMARGEKPYLRKSADRKAQISPLSWVNVFLICALRSADFLR